MLLRPYTFNNEVPLQERNVVDLQLTVEGLSKLFIKFLYEHPTNSADMILTMLITHLRHHYEHPIVLEHLHLIRFMVWFIMYFMKIILFYHTYNINKLDIFIF